MARGHPCTLSITQEVLDLKTLDNVWPSLCFKFIPTQVLLKEVKRVEVAGRVGTLMARGVPCFNCSLNKHSNFKTHQLLFSSISVKTLISLITNVCPSACKLNYPASLRRIKCYTERSRLGGNSLCV